MKSLKRISLLVLIIALFSCAPKPVIQNVQDDTWQKVADANKDVCAYKGKILLGYEKDNLDMDFKGMLDKQCNGDFHLIVFGLFNMIALDVEYKDGEVKAKKNNEDVTGLVNYFFKSKHADTIVKLIRYPFLNVDKSYALKTDGNEYIFTKDDTEIRAGQDYMITSIKTDKRTFNYEYQDGKMYNMTFDNQKEKVTIGLR